MGAALSHLHGHRRNDDARAGEGEHMLLDAKAIRREMLERALKMGRGHLSSSLSWVEIAIAIFTVMKPEDRLVLSKTHGHLTLDTILGDKIPDCPMWPGWPFRTS